MKPPLSLYMTQAMLFYAVFVNIELTGNIS